MMDRLAIRKGIELAGLTTLKVGGKAEFLVQPRTVAELSESLQWAEAQRLAVTAIGAGSNLLISDRGLAGLVVCTRYLRGVEFAPTGAIRALAGEPIGRLAWQASARGWSGLEWGVGIPGTVGGMVYMNAGAQGGCCADILVSVQVVDRHGNFAVIPAHELQFAYRYSLLQSAQWEGMGIISADLQLKTGFAPTAIHQKTEQNFQQRHSTQPYHLPNCGSVFRNPYPQTAGRLLEEAGLKGYTIGKAQVSPMHANFIVNLGGATADQVYQLIQYAQGVIQAKYAISLHPEVKMLGDFN